MHATPIPVPAGVTVDTYRCIFGTTLILIKIDCECARASIEEATNRDAVPAHSLSDVPDDASNTNGGGANGGTSEAQTEPTQEPQASLSNGREHDGLDANSRMAVAAKISAARALARALAEEQQAAVTAARLAAEHSMDDEEIQR